MNIFKKKGIAIITVLGVCFVLLALGTVLMINSYAHMTMSMKYYYDTEALNIAEGGVNYVIHELEKYPNLNDIPPDRNYTDNLGRGHFTACAYNNITHNTHSARAVPLLSDTRSISPYSILIVSQGNVTAGGHTYSKIVETLVHYQFVPYTLSSEGNITMNIGGTPPMSIKVNSINGFTSNIHSNSTGGEAFKGENRSLELNGAVISASGLVGGASEISDLQAGGASIENNVPKKTFFKLTYNNLKNKFTPLSLGQNIPAGFYFCGKLRKSGSRLEAYCEDEFGTESWFDLEALEPMFGRVLPDGMNWDGTTLNISGSDASNGYYWNDDLVLEGVNIKVADNVTSGLFIDGNITSSDSKIEGKGFTLAATGDIELRRTAIHITSPLNTNKIAVLGKSLTISTNTSENKFKGIVYTTGGQINLTNKCGTANSIMSLEGIIINCGSSSTAGLNVKNEGGSGYQVEFKYNPYVTDYAIDHATASVYLQPVYWRIE